MCSFQCALSPSLPDEPRTEDEVVAECPTLAAFLFLRLGRETTTRNPLPRPAKLPQKDTKKPLISTKNRFLKSPLTADYQVINQSFKEAFYKNLPTARTHVLCRIFPNKLYF
jgi:hypothetical protein